MRYFFFLIVFFFLSNDGVSAAAQPQNDIWGYSFDGAASLKATGASASDVSHRFSKTKEALAAAAAAAVADEGAAEIPTVPLLSPSLADGGGVAARAARVSAMQSSDAAAAAPSAATRAITDPYPSSGLADGASSSFPREGSADARFPSYPAGSATAIARRASRTAAHLHEPTVEEVTRSVAAAASRPADLRNQPLVAAAADVPTYQVALVAVGGDVHAGSGEAGVTPPRTSSGGRAGSALSLLGGGGVSVVLKNPRRFSNPADYRGPLAPLRRSSTTPGTLLGALTQVRKSITTHFIGGGSRRPSAYSLVTAGSDEDNSLEASAAVGAPQSSPGAAVADAFHGLVSPGASPGDPAKVLPLRASSRFGVSSLRSVPEAASLAAGAERTPSRRAVVAEALAAAQRVPSGGARAGIVAGEVEAAVRALHLVQDSGVGPLVLVEDWATRATDFVRGTAVSGSASAARPVPAVSSERRWPFTPGFNRSSRASDRPSTGVVDWVTGEYTPGGSGAVRVSSGGIRPASAVSNAMRATPRPGGGGGASAATPIEVLAASVAAMADGAPARIASGTKVGTWLRRKFRKLSNFVGAHRPAPPGRVPVGAPNAMRTASGQSAAAVGAPLVVTSNPAFGTTAGGDSARTLLRGGASERSVSDGLVAVDGSVVIQSPLVGALAPGGSARALSPRGGSGSHGQAPSPGGFRNPAHGMAAPGLRTLSGRSVPTSASLPASGAAPVSAGDGAVSTTTALRRVPGAPPIRAFPAAPSSVAAPISPPIAIVADSASSEGDDGVPHPLAAVHSAARSDGSGAPLSPRATAAAAAAARDSRLVVSPEASSSAGALAPSARPPLVAPAASSSLAPGVQVSPQLAAAAALQPIGQHAGIFAAMAVFVGKALVHPALAPAITMGYFITAYAEWRSLVDAYNQSQAVAAANQTLYITENTTLATQVGDFQTAISSLTSSNATLTSQNVALTTQIGALQITIDGLHQQVSDLTTQLAGLAGTPAELATLQAQISDLQQTITTLEAEKVILEHDKASLIAAISSLGTGSGGPAPATLANQQDQALTLSDLNDKAAILANQIDALQTNLNFVVNKIAFMANQVTAIAASQGKSDTPQDLVVAIRPRPAGYRDELRSSSNSNSSSSSSSNSSSSVVVPASVLKSLQDSITALNQRLTDVENQLSAVSTTVVAAILNSNTALAASLTTVQAQVAMLSSVMGSSNAAFTAQINALQTNLGFVVNKIAFMASQVTLIAATQAKVSESQEKVTTAIPRPLASREIARTVTPAPLPVPPTFGQYLRNNLASFDPTKATTYLKVAAAVAAVCKLGQWAGMAAGWVK